MRPILRALIVVGWGVTLLAFFAGFVILRFAGSSFVSSGEGGLVVVAGLAMVFVAGLVLTVFVLPGFGRFFRKTKATYRNDYVADPQAELLLYLRPFSADCTLFSLPRNHEVRQERAVTDRLDSKVSLEELVVSAFAETHRVVAIGKPDELLRPIGANRVYSDQWQAEVDALIHDAGIIAICLGESPGVVWELEAIIAKGKLKETVVVVPPLESEEAMRIWSTWRDVLELHGATCRDLPSNAKLVVFSQQHSARFVSYDGVDASPSGSSTQLEFYFASLREIISTMKLRSQDTYIDFDEDIRLEFVDRNRKQNDFLPPSEGFEEPSYSFEPPREWRGE
ncbi:MAG: hypothetical protein AAFN77_22685 [Planctomycetota bacterium]